MGRVGRLLDAAAFDVKVVCMFRKDAECAKPCCTGSCFFVPLACYNFQKQQKSKQAKMVLSFVLGYGNIFPVIVVELDQSSHPRDLLRSEYLFKNDS